MTQTLSRLEQLRQNFAKPQGGGNQSNSNKYYKFWNIPVDSTAIFRFLPDADELNPFGFLVENKVHELKVNGERKHVACLSMYGEPCPICNHSSDLYAKGRAAKEAGDLAAEARWNAEGKQFYRRLSYIGQGLVVESPIEVDKEPLIKLIDFGPQVHKLIQAAFQSGDFETEPFDFFEGYNTPLHHLRQKQQALILML
jgi:hypothetical protein